MWLCALSIGQSCVCLLCQLVSCVFVSPVSWSVLCLFALRAGQLCVHVLCMFLVSCVFVCSVTCVHAL